jgi:hypothetical protein
LARLGHAFFHGQEMQVFDASTTMTVGDGGTALFWLDRWLDVQTMSDTEPELFALIPKRARKRRTVREALVERRWISDIQGALSLLAIWQYVQLWIRVRDIQLSDGPDTLL